MRRKLETRTWLVRGNAALDVAPVAVELIRCYHGEPGDPFWTIDNGDGYSCDVLDSRRDGVRRAIADTLREVRATVLEAILDTAADRARDMLETLIERGDTLRALAALGGIDR